MTPPDEHRRNNFWVLIKALLAVWVILALVGGFVWAVSWLFS